MRLICRALVISGLLSAQAAFAQTTGAGGSAGAAAAPPAAGAPSAAPAAAAPAPAVSPAPAAAPAAAAPPASLTPTTAQSGGDVKKTGSAIDLSLPPSVPTIGSGAMINSKQAESLTATTSGAADEWKFEFHGYMRAPIRASWGPPSPTALPAIQGSNAPAGSVAPYLPGAAPPPGTQLHGVTRVPGSNYTTWEYTNTLTGPWSQLNFSYGNSRVTTTIVVDAYNQTDGSYRNIQAQQGIDQAFLTLRFPDAFGDYGGLVWNIGSFPNRYGTAGKYDGGMYETYLFGRTHVSGETLSANFSNLDPMGDWSITVEHGLGAKMDIVPFLNNQNYQVFGSPMGMPTSGSPYISDRDVEYLPYSGPVPQGSTYLHHAHILAKYKKTWNFGLHYLYTWTPDDNWHPTNSVQPYSTDMVPRARGPIQGSMAIAGGEARFAGGDMGDGYIGYSHIDARNINALADSVEVLHSYSGYNFKQNYFGQSFNRHTGVYQGPQNETGKVDTISLQYSFSFGAYARAPEDFWGDGPDLVVTAFGMMSIVDSKAPPIATASDPTRVTTWDMSTKKLKFGLDGLYTPLSWLGGGLRFDQVRPDISGAYARTPGNPGGGELDFSVLTGRLVLKTQFVTHETVTLQYSRYFLGSAAYPAPPYAWVAKADANAVELSATMWW